nr:hypothetical protein [uncultured Methanoregula sp.]
MDSNTNKTENAGNDISGTGTAGEKSYDSSVPVNPGPGRENVRDAFRPGSRVPKTGENSPLTRRTRTRAGTSPRPKLAARATALRGLSISRPLEPKSSLRRQTLLDIYSKDSEIPYLKLDAAIRDIVCALMERQDRMNEVLFCKLNDLEYRVGDLEEDQTAEGNGS